MFEELPIERWLRLNYSRMRPMYLRRPQYCTTSVTRRAWLLREDELGGLSAELAEREDEETPLRDALWWVDMTTTPGGEPTNVHDRIEEIQTRYGPEELVTFFIRQS
jgi:hypothetical protein